MSCKKCARLEVEVEALSIRAAMLSIQLRAALLPGPVWVQCPGCEDYRCELHSKHVHDCDCPDRLHWQFDPYSEPRP